MIYKYLNGGGQKQCIYSTERFACVGKDASKFAETKVGRFDFLCKRYGGAGRTNRETSLLTLEICRCSLTCSR